MVIDSRILCFVVLAFFFVVASCLARAAQTAARFAVRATNALLPVFLCLDDVTGGRAYDQSYHKD